MIPGMEISEEEVKETPENSFVDDPAHKSSQIPNPESQLLPQAAEVSAWVQQQPPTQQQQSTTNDLPSPTEGHRDGELDPDNKHHVQNEPDPDEEETEDAHDPNAAAEDQNEVPKHPHQCVARMTQNRHRSGH